MTVRSVGGREGEMAGWHGQYRGQNYEEWKRKERNKRRRERYHANIDKFRADAKERRDSKREPEMEAWSLHRKRLSEFLRGAVDKRFRGDPLVETEFVSAGEFRVRIHHMDARVKSRSFVIKVIQEKT